MAASRAGRVPAGSGVLHLAAEGPLPRPATDVGGARAERFEIRLLFSATAEPILSEVAGALAGVPLEVGRVARGKETDAIAEHGRPDVAVVYLPASHAVALREALPVPLDALVIEERGGGAPPA